MTYEVLGHKIKTKAKQKSVSKLIASCLLQFVYYTESISVKVARA